jgi:hypothetical protein
VRTAGSLKSVAGLSRAEGAFAAHTRVAHAAGAIPQTRRPPGPPERPRAVRWGVAAIDPRSAYFNVASASWALATDSA